MARRGKRKGLKKQKRPRVEGSPSGKKVPSLSDPHWEPPRAPVVAQAPTDLWQQRPSWRVAHLETADPFGWHTLDRPKALTIHEKLRSFESMTWQEILVAGKKQHHLVRVDRLSKPARDRLQALKLDDLDELLSLRLSGRERVWGILQEGVALLLWWDPEHQVCPSILRHT